VNTSDKYRHFELVKEMMQTPDIVRRFKLDDVEEIKRAIGSTGKLLLTGEGSSRIFPAKGAIYSALTVGGNLNMITEGARQAAEYALSDFVVFGTSNSGSTKEVIALFDKLTKAGHKNLFGLTAREETTLARYAARTLVLTCGWEQAVAATKSVVEQALVFQELLAQVRGTSIGPQLAPLADAMQTALTLEIDPAIAAAIANAGTIYFAGKINCVA
jgi:glucosamine--fructose-6-phosphate aminotransferase (isomerizing)